MASYLEQFRSGLKASQSEQLLSLLSKEKDAGSITSIAEFKERLQELTTNLESEVIKPTLTLFLGEPDEIIDSESYNFMLSRIEDDLTTAFREMNTIDEVLDSHETIINDVILKTIDFALSELENKLDSLEFLAQDSNGHDNVFFNTFKSPTANSLDAIFIDPKTDLRNNGSNKAQVNLLGEALVLGAIETENYAFSEARVISDSSATATELTADLDGSDIKHIIDGRKGTFYLTSNLTSYPQGDSGIINKIELTLSTVRTINFIDIEPIVNFPVQLTSVVLIDGNNKTTSLLNSPLEIKSDRRIFFNNRPAKKIILSFTNKNFKIVQFTKKPNELIAVSAEQIGNFEEVSNSILGQLDALVANPILRQQLGVDLTSEEEQSFYQYSFGLDNIRAGQAQFQDNSIFTGPTHTIDCLGQLSIKSNIKVPVGDISGTAVVYKDLNDVLSTDFVHSTVEFYLLKRDLNAAGGLLSSRTMPLLPVGTSSVYHERLILNDKTVTTSTVNNLGRLQLFTLNNQYHSIDNPTGDIKVYRNGILLESAEPTLGVNAALETDGWLIETSDSEFQPNQGTPMKVAIRIQNPNPNNIYTVSYTPAISTTNTVPRIESLSSFTANSGNKMTDLTGTLSAWLGKGNIVYFNPIESGSEVAQSLINLIIVLRRNSANVALTPVIEDYQIATGCRSGSKF